LGIIDRSKDPILRLIHMHTAYKKKKKQII